MVDSLKPEIRRRVMRSVRTKGTEPERRLAEVLLEFGLRFRCNDRGVFGCPDFSFRACSLAVFVDGDFWHGRKWFAEGSSPATNADFWVAKFERNRTRDRIVDRMLRRKGWSVLRLWGSEVNKEPRRCAQRVRARLRRLARAGRTFPSRKRRPVAKRLTRQAGE